MALDYAVIDPGESGVHANGSATWTGWVIFSGEGGMQAGMRHAQGGYIP